MKGKYSILFGRQVRKKPGWDPVNAISLSNTPETYMRRLSTFFARFDRRPDLSKGRFADGYIRARTPRTDASAERRISRAVDVNLKTLKRASPTMEVRAIAGQRSAHNLILQVRLFLTTFAMLDKIDKAIPLLERRIPSVVPPPFANGFQPWPQPDPTAVLQSYYEFVTEAGLRWDDYKHMVLSQWRIEGGALERFEPKPFAPLRQQLGFTCDASFATN